MACEQKDPQPNTVAQTSLFEESGSEKLESGEKAAEVAPDEKTPESYPDMEMRIKVFQQLVRPILDICTTPNTLKVVGLGIACKTYGEGYVLEIDSVLAADYQNGFQHRHMWVNVPHAGPRNIQLLELKLGYSSHAISFGVGMLPQ